MKKNKVLIPIMCGVCSCISAPMVSLVSCGQEELKAIPEDALIISEDKTLVGIDENKVDLSRCNELLIPDNVCKIAEAAFVGTFTKAKNCKVTKISFSPNLKYVGGAAFSGCNTITTLDFGRMDDSDFAELNLNSRQQAFLGMPESFEGNIVFPPVDRPDVDLTYNVLHKLCYEGGLPAFWLNPKSCYQKLEQLVVGGTYQQYPTDPIYTPLNEKDMEWLTADNFADVYLNTYVRHVPGIFIDDLMWTYSHEEERAIMWAGKTIVNNKLKISNVRVGDEEERPLFGSWYNLSFDVHFSMSFTDNTSVDYTVNYINMQVNINGPWGWNWPTLAFNLFDQQWGQKIGTWHVTITNNDTGSIKELETPNDLNALYSANSNLFYLLIHTGRDEGGKIGAYIRPHFFINRQIPN